MGKIIRLKKKESKKGKTPKIYANLDECWQDLISELNLKGTVPDTPNLNERIIFTMGSIAGKRKAQGLWKSPEQTPRDKGRDASIVAEVEKLLRLFPTQRDWIEKTVMDLKSAIFNRYDAYIAAGRSVDEIKKSAIAMLARDQSA